MDQNNSNHPNVIPFGKYKGQPADVLAADPKYVEWLNGQGWVKDKYPQFYTVIINNFQEPSDTPEHNALQVLFLDDEFCNKFFSNSLSYKGDDLRPFKIVHRQFENKGVDVDLCCQYFSCNDFLKNKKSVGEERWHYASGYRPYTMREAIGSSFGYESYAVEIKPSLGDDFPSILRQVSHIKTDSSTIKYLMFRDFVVTNVTLDQVRAMFSHSRIRVLSLAEIEQTEIDTRFDDWYKANVEQIGVNHDGLQG